jgi:hypothetical protein
LREMPQSGARVYLTFSSNWFVFSLGSKFSCLAVHVP